MSALLTHAVRLDAQERVALRHALATAGSPRAFLFGSRTDPDKRGGDIDVLVFSDQEPFDLSRRIATTFFSQCEEKIDVVVMNPDRLSAEQQSFLNTLSLVEIP